MTVEPYLPMQDPGVRGLRMRLGLDQPADELSLYVGTMSRSWVIAMADAIRASTKTRIVVGLDVGLTAAAADVLRAIATPSREVVLVRHQNPTVSFHPKLYIARHGNDVKGVVGSANASTAAFDFNIETNLALAGTNGSAEEKWLTEIRDGVEDSLAQRSAAGAVEQWKLPSPGFERFLVAPVRLPGAPRQPEASVGSRTGDEWQLESSLLDAELVADFTAPMSGVTSPRSKQLGFYIPVPQRPALESLIPRDVGAQLVLAWRFVTQDGQTLLASDEPPRRVKLSGFSGHNRVITVPIALRTKLNERLRELGMGQGTAHVIYKLEHHAIGPPTLWLLHTIPIPSTDLPEEAL